jgi:hypothetical protein
MSYGMDSDILGFSDTATGISLQSVSDPTMEASEAQAEDSNGDVVAETLYDTDAGHSVSCEYKCYKNLLLSTSDTSGGTATGLSLIVGTVVNGYVITGFDISTGNKEFPGITVNAQKTNASDSDVAKYTVDQTFYGRKQAQAFGFAVDTNSRLIGSTLTVSGDIGDRVLDSTGSELALDLNTGRMEGSHDIQGVTGAPGGAADTGWSLLNGPSEDESNTEYASGSATVFQNLTQDT